MPKAWKTPTEVDTAQLPAGRRADPDRLAFAEDVMRRLEQTPPNRALRYVFADAKVAQLYRSFLTTRAAKLTGKKGSVYTTSVAEKDEIAVYIRRGSNW